MSATAVFIVMPAYNEEEVIESVIKKLYPVFRNIVVVNDGSTDRTEAQVQKTKAQLINHPINLGQGAALQTGIEFAVRQKAAKYVATFDSDGQHKASDVKKMLRVIEKGKHDVVLGSRFLSDSSRRKVPQSKRILLHFATKLTRYQTGLNLTDSHNGLRLFTVEAASKLDIQSSGMAHASEILSKIAQLNLRYAEVPVTIEYTAYSKSKGQSILNSVNVLFDLMLGRFSQ